jgi:hypothetical protein
MQIITNNRPRPMACFANLPAKVQAAEGEGPTPLIAAMRCYVQSRLGDEVDVPKELQ